MTPFQATIPFIVDWLDTPVGVSPTHPTHDPPAELTSPAVWPSAFAYAASRDWRISTPSPSASTLWPVSTGWPHSPPRPLRRRATPRREQHLRALSQSSLGEGPPWKRPVRICSFVSIPMAPSCSGVCLVCTAFRAPFPKSPWWVGCQMRSPARGFSTSTMSPSTQTRWWNRPSCA